MPGSWKENLGNKWGCKPKIAVVGAGEYGRFWIEELGPRLKSKKLGAISSVLSYSHQETTRSLFASLSCKKHNFQGLSKQS